MQMTALNAVAMAVGRLIVRGDSNIVVAHQSTHPTVCPFSFHFGFEKHVHHRDPESSPPANHTASRCTWRRWMTRRVRPLTRDNVKKHLANVGLEDIASSLNNLAALYKSQERYGEAEPLMVEVLAMRRRVHSAEKDHPMIATSLGNLAALYHAQERYNEVEPLILEALEMWRRMYSVEKDHPLIATSLSNLAKLYYT